MQWLSNQHDVADGDVCCRGVCQSVRAAWQLAKPANVRVRRGQTSAPRRCLDRLGTLQVLFWELLASVLLSVSVFLPYLRKVMMLRPWLCRLTSQTSFRHIQTPIPTSCPSAYIGGAELHGGLATLVLIARLTTGMTE